MKITIIIVTMAILNRIFVFYSNIFKYKYLTNEFEIQILLEQRI